MVADQSTRRRESDDPGLAAASRPHFLQFTFALCQLFDDSPSIFVIDVDSDFFNRLHPDTVFLAEQDAPRVKEKL